MRRLMVGPVLAVLIVLAAGCTNAESDGRAGELADMTNTVRDSDSNVPLLMLLYMVYGFNPSTGECEGGVNSAGWNRQQERFFYPEAGYYCVADPAYIANAVAQMKSIGVDTLLFSWNGWGDVDFDGTIRAIDFKATNDAIIKWFEYLTDNEPDMKAAILVEPFFQVGAIPIKPANVTADQKLQILNHVWDNIYEAFPATVFNWEEKPLIVSYWGASTPGTLDGHWTLAGIDPRFTVKDWGVINEGANWEFTAYQGLEGMKIGTDGAIWIAPRFDEYYIWNSGSGFVDKEFSDLVRLDPDLTEGLYDRAWEKVFDNREDVMMVMLYGWNPWAEAASIEPAVPYGDVLLQKTAWYHNRFVEGKPFSNFGARTGGTWATPDDLRDIIGPVNPSKTLNMNSDMEVDQFLSTLIARAQSHVTSYLRRSFEGEPLPDAVKEINLRLASNLYNHALKVRQGPLVQAGEFELQLVDDAVFTDSLRRDLTPFKKRQGMKVLFP